jgi:two-component system response regulator CpxR
MRKTRTLQILTVLSENADSADETGWTDRDSGGAVCLDMKVLLAYKVRGAALQFLTINPGDPWHDGPLSAHGGRKIFPISVERVGNKFRWSDHMTQSMEMILVIDDDKELCELLEEYLTHEGFLVETAHDGEKGIEKALTRAYGVVVLDVMLPGKHDGFDVLKQMRAGTNTPVLMLTARGDDVDRIVGLEMGADDYLTKPFNPRELVARLRAILRRSNRETERVSVGTTSARYRVGDVGMDTGTRTVLRADKPVDLTSVEFALLEILLFKAGHIVTREELTRTVLGRSLTPYDRSIDVHISKLRKKLGQESGGTERIKSIRSSGYIYVLPKISRSGD